MFAINDEDDDDSFHTMFGVRFSFDLVNALVKQLLNDDSFSPNRLQYEVILQDAFYTTGEQGYHINKPIHRRH